MDVAAIRAKLATVISAGVTTTPDLVATAHLPGTVVAPCIFPAEVDLDAQHAMGGIGRATIKLRALVGRSDEPSAEDLLDSLMKMTGATSVAAAIHGARDTSTGWGSGTCDDVVVKRIEGRRFYEHAGVEYLGAEWVLDVIGDGD